MNNNLEVGKKKLIAGIDRRLADGIIEKSNADLIKKLIVNADSLNEAIQISELGTTYKKTGFQFDKRLDKIDPTIKYYKKNEELSFSDDTLDIPNKLIIGDNYDALMNLLIQYKNKINIIYIDPPYGKDSMGEFAKVNYENAITRDNLLSMLYPRLKLALELLSDDGAIFCSIDDKNYAYVKCLFDEVFQEKNFIGTLVWRKKSGGGQTDEFFVTEHEYILAYRKTSEFKWIDFTEESDKNLKDDNKGKGKYETEKLEKWGSASHKEDRPTMYFPIKSPDGKDFYPVAPDGMPGRWRVGRERLYKLIEDDDIVWDFNKDTQRYVPKEKKYVEGGKKIKIKKSRSILYNLAETGTATNLLTSIFGKKDLFENPKPIELIKFILEHTCSDLVLDFFAGSGTTGQAVMELNKDGENRKFILCTSNEITKTTPNGIAYDVTTKRLKRTMTGKCYDNSADFKWNENNEPYGGSLDVYEICEVSSFENVSGKTPFDVIDETLYGKEKFATLKEKIEWVCNNFDITQKSIESDEEWKKRVEEMKNATRGY